MLADEIRAMAPRESAWVTMDAERVRTFAEATGDRQAIHLDPEFASQTAFGGTIAHGFLTLSMLAAMSTEITEGLEGLGPRVNYGFDRIRFTAPVRVGRRIRGRFSVAGVDEGEGWLDVHWDVEMEIEAEARPALAANWITRFYLSAAAAGGDELDG
jgi:acyl dehydratase